MNNIRHCKLVENELFFTVRCLLHTHTHTQYLLHTLSFPKPLYELNDERAKEFERLVYSKEIFVEHLYVNKNLN